MKKMIPIKSIEKLVDNAVYIYSKDVSKEFGGILKEISDHDIVKLEDKNNNSIHLPLSEIVVITERQ